MSPLLAGALVGLACWTSVSALLALSCCIVRARDNAAKRKARRSMSAEALELAQMRREFDRIVAASYARGER